MATASWLYKCLKLNDNMDNSSSIIRLECVIVNALDEWAMGRVALKTSLIFYEALDEDRKVKPELLRKTISSANKQEEGAVSGSLKFRCSCG
jgi:hypothetical protein